MWEYKRIDFYYKYITELENKLKELGDESWEIIHYQDILTEKNQRAIIIAKKPKNGMYPAG